MTEELHISCCRKGVLHSTSMAHGFKPWRRDCWPVSETPGIIIPHHPIIESINPCLDNKSRRLGAQPLAAAAAWAVLRQVYFPTQTQERCTLPMTRISFQDAVSCSFWRERFSIRASPKVAPFCTHGERIHEVKIFITALASLFDIEAARCYHITERACFGNRLSLRWP